MLKTIVTIVAVAVAVAVVVVAAAGVGWVVWDHFQQPPAGEAQAPDGEAQASPTPPAEWPVLVCQNTGIHSAMTVGAQGEIWMHDLEEIKSSGDTCVLTLTSGVTMNYVNSSAGRVWFNGTLVQIGNPCSLDGKAEVVGPGEVKLQWGKNNASAGSMFSLSRP